MIYSTHMLIIITIVGIILTMCLSSMISKLKSLIGIIILEIDVLITCIYIYIDIDVHRFDYIDVYIDVC